MKEGLFSDLLIPRGLGKIDENTGLSLSLVRKKCYSHWRCADLHPWKTRWGRASFQGAAQCCAVLCHPSWVPSSAALLGSCWGSEFGWSPPVCSFILISHSTEISKLLSKHSIISTVLSVQMRNHSSDALCCSRTPVLTLPSPVLP